MLFYTRFSRFRPSISAFCLPPLSHFRLLCCREVVLYCLAWEPLENRGGGMDLKDKRTSREREEKRREKEREKREREREERKRERREKRESEREREKRERRENERENIESNWLGCISGSKLVVLNQVSPHRKDVLILLSAQTANLYVRARVVGRQCQTLSPQ